MLGVAAIASTASLRFSDSGTRISGGRISGYETNRNLRGSKWVEQANKILRTDPYANAGSQGYIQTIKSAQWAWRQGRDTDHARMLADFARDMWARMSIPWEVQVGTACRFAETGFRYLEQINRVKRAADGSMRTMIDCLADCEPSAHDRWITNDGETLDGVAQFRRSFGNGIGRRSTRREQSGNPITPSSRLLLLTHGFTGTNWEGDGGLLRPVNGAFVDKCHALSARGVAIDKWSAAIPAAQYDFNAMVDSGIKPGSVSTEVARISALLENLAIGEAVGITYPVGVDLKEWGGSFDGSSLDDVIKQCDAQMLMGWLQPFLGMGSNDTGGSRSLALLAETHFRRWVINELDYMAAQINGAGRPGAGIIGRIVEANWPGTDEQDYPRIEAFGLVDGFELFIGQLSALAANGLLTSEAMLTEVLDRMGVSMSPEAIASLVSTFQLRESRGAEGQSFGEAGDGAPRLDEAPSE